MFEQICKRSLSIDETVLRKLSAVLLRRSFDEAPVEPLKCLGLDDFTLPSFSSELPAIQTLTEEWNSMKELLKLCNLDRKRLLQELYTLLHYLAHDPVLLDLHGFKTQAGPLSEFVEKQELNKEPRTRTQSPMSSIERAPLEENGLRESSLLNYYCSPASLGLSLSTDEANVSDSEFAHQVPRFLEFPLFSILRAQLPGPTAATAATPLQLAVTSVPEHLRLLLKKEGGVPEFSPCFKSK